CQLFPDDHNSLREFDRQLTSSGGYSSRASHQSRDLDTPTALLRPETATWICNNFKSLRACVGKPEEMVKMAQPLFNIPKNKRWPASVVMQLCWFESFIGPPQVPLEKVVALKVQPSTSLITSYSLSQDAIDGQSTDWLKTHLSIKWREDGDLVEKVDQAIVRRLKTTRMSLRLSSRLDSRTQTGVWPDALTIQGRCRSQENLPGQGDHIGCSSLIGLLEAAHSPQSTQTRAGQGHQKPSPSPLLDGYRRGSCPSCGQAGYLQDRALWGNDTTLAKDVTADQAALPTNEEIAAKIAQLNGRASEDKGADGENDKENDHDFSP
ncbi:hypothetical protein PSTT_02355, partial [Puccinia striiformis]